LAPVGFVELVSTMSLCMATLAKPGQLIIRGLLTTTSFTVTDLGIKEGKLHALLADEAVITG